MANRVCEKCIHYDVCLLHEDNFIEDANKNGFCGKFKNKNDVVEITEVVEVLCKIKTQIIKMAKTTIEAQFTQIVKDSLKGGAKMDGGNNGQN